MNSKNESAFSEIDCEVKRGDPYGYHILLNGIDVSNHVTKFSYEITGSDIPTITLRIPVRSFKANGKVLLNQAMSLTGKTVNTDEKTRRRSRPD